jgi:UPF0755 protein
MARRGEVDEQPSDLDDGFDDFAHDVEAIPAHYYSDDEHEYEVIRRRRRRSPGKRVFLWTLVLLIFGALIAGLLTWRWVQRQVDPPGDPGEQVIVLVPEGATTDQIGELLADQGVVTDATVFRYYVRVKGGGPWQAGTYTLQQNSSMQEAIEVLDAGPAPPPFVEFTVPEGLTLPEITEAMAGGVSTLNVDTLNQLVASGQVRSRYQPPEVASLEGYLFPETYRLDEGADELTALQTMVNQFDGVADQIDLAGGAAALNLTPYQVVTVASLIQEEARIPDDMAKISRVIYNRLAQGIPLGVDATICYVLGERPCELTEADLGIDSPYNSRTQAGLPPSPIAAPGRAALEAALHPADGPWLYYVLDPNAEVEGGHFFTDDYAEFLRVKDECAAAGLGCG